MGAGSVVAAVNSSSEAELKALIAFLPPETRAKLATAVQEDHAEDSADDDDDEEKKAALGKKGMGMKRKNFAKQMEPGRTAAPKEAGKATKRVLMVIDVQDGYDAEFLKTLEGPGGHRHIQEKHAVKRSVELVSKAVITQYEEGKEPQITYDKRWNRGLPDAAMAPVVKRTISEIKSGAYDLVVFTTDYLERAKPGSDELGVFPLDSTPWKDPKKPVALVGYGQYLTIAAGCPGVDVSHRIRTEVPDVTSLKGAEGTANGVPALYFRKQVDDAFDDDTEASERTNNEAWLDDVDVDDDGLPRRDAQTLLQKLTAKGFGPDEASLSFVGVVTNRCVASSLLHAVKNGYQTRCLIGGCRAADGEGKQHTSGLTLIKEKGGDAVEMVE